MTSDQLDALIHAPRDHAFALGRAVRDQRAAVVALAAWRKTGDLGVVFDVLHGMRHLAWDHAFYFGLCSEGVKARDPSTAVEVLGDVLANSDASKYAARSARRWFRSLYDQRVPLTPAATQILKKHGVVWDLVPLTSSREAWKVLIAMTTTDSVDRVSAGGCPNVWEIIDGAIAGDVLLAGFIAANPGVLEREVLARIRELADRDGSSGKNALSNLLETGVDHIRWQRTYAAWDAELGLALFQQAQRERLLDVTTVHNSFHVAALWNRRAPARGLPPEMRDVLRALDDGEPLPNILPDDLSGHTPDAIDAALARYAGVSVPELHARLQPGALSTAGFIRPGDSLGALIARDAETLRARGVSRHVLADRLAAALRGDIAGVEMDRVAAMGHQQDPFHLYDAYDLHHHGAVSFTIRRGGVAVSGGDLQLPLIRRACLFGGTSYRLEPEALIAILL